MGRMSEIACIVAAALFSAVGESFPAPSLDWIGRWGAPLAIVLFMIVQQYRQSARMALALNRKDSEISAANARANETAVIFADAIKENSRAIQGIADALKDRKCVAGDSGIDAKVQT